MLIVLNEVSLVKSNQKSTIKISIDVVDHQRISNNAFKPSAAHQLHITIQQQQSQRNASG
jgi:hypothetical protein